MAGSGQPPAWRGERSQWFGSTGAPPETGGASWGVLFVRRLVGAGQVIPANAAARAAVAGFAGMTVDLAAFLILLGLGAGLTGAQLASFGLATLCHYGLVLRRAVAEGAVPTASPRSGLYARVLVVVLLALALRSGVLATAAGLLGLPAPLALLPAIGVTAIVCTLGTAFFIGPGVPAPLSRAARWRLAALGVVAYSMMLRLLFLGVAELMPQEAYYWNYAQHLDIGYLDHPPMVAWLIWLGTGIFGTSEFGVRIAAWLCWGVTALFTFGLAGRLFGRSAAFVSVMLVAALPFYFGTGLVMTPDAPLTACWAGTLYFLERALRGGRAGAWWGAGLCLGLGLLSKYTIVLLVPAALLFMLLDPRARAWFRRPEAYLSAGLAVLLFSPVILWNLENGLASFAFQSSRRIEGAFRFSLPELLLGAAGLLTPTVLVAALAVLWLRERAVRPQAPGVVVGAGPAPVRENQPEPWLFVGLFTLVPLAVFVVFSLFHMSRLNWTGPLWLAVLPAVAASLLAASDPVGAVQRHLQRAFMPTVAICLVLYGLGLNYLVAGLPGLERIAPFPAVPLAWSRFGAEAAELADEVKVSQGQEPLLIGLDTYNIASELAFYAAGAHAAHGISVGRGVLGQPALMYGYWYRPETAVDRPAVLFAFTRRQIENPSLAASFEELGEVKQREVTRNGRVEGHFYYRIGRLAAQPAPSGEAQAFAASMARD